MSSPAILARSSLAVCCLAVLLNAVTSWGETPETVGEAQSAPQLAAFEPFVGKTWMGLVDDDKEIYDVARWERALGGQAVRIVHSVGDGAYGGETIVMWDRAREELVYYYFTTAGFYTHGTMSFDAAGHLISREFVEGHKGGVTEVRATQEVLPDGRLRVRTQMLRYGDWEERDEVLYSVAVESQGSR